MLTGCSSPARSPLQPSACHQSVIQRLHAATRTVTGNVRNGKSPSTTRTTSLLRQFRACSLTPPGPRVAQMANMLMETVQWINTTYPFWQRRSSQDHIWVFTHDEGACWAPNVLTPSIWLTHWGRMDKDHKACRVGHGDLT